MMLAWFNVVLYTEEKNHMKWKLYYDVAIYFLHGNSINLKLKLPSLMPKF